MNTASGMHARRDASVRQVLRAGCSGWGAGGPRRSSHLHLRRDASVRQARIRVRGLKNDRPYPDLPFDLTGLSRPRGKEKNLEEHKGKSLQERRGK